jgi:hypothetical protein
MPTAALNVIKSFTLTDVMTVSGYNEPNWCSKGLSMD